MDVHKPTSAAQTAQEMEQAMLALAQTIREAGECLLDLQEAVEKLHLAQQPALLRAVHDEAAGCIRAAMRR
jgi:hypothetical protein